MQKVVKIVTPIAIIIVAVIVISLQDSNREVCFSSSCITVKVADSPEERARGLMYVSNLPEDEGMLFIFDNPERHSFWMKNTLIPLDILWLSEDKEIADLTTLQPCEQDPCPSYTPKRAALYVVEVNAGFAERNGVRIGDTVSIN